MQSAVPPVLTRTKEQQGDDAARRFFANLRGLSLTLLVTVTALARRLRRALGVAVRGRFPRDPRSIRAHRLAHALGVPLHPVHGHGRARGGRAQYVPALHGHRLRPCPAERGVHRLRSRVAVVARRALPRRGRARDRSAARWRAAGARAVAELARHRLRRAPALRFRSPRGAGGVAAHGPRDARHGRLLRRRAARAALSLRTGPRRAELLQLGAPALRLPPGHLRDGAADRGAAEPVAARQHG